MHKAPWRPHEQEQAAYQEMNEFLLLALLAVGLFLAGAGLASLQTRNAAGLLEKAGGFGVPLPPAVADDIVQHFADKRAAVLTYRR